MNKFYACTFIVQALPVMKLEAIFYTNQENSYSGSSLLVQTSKRHACGGLGVYKEVSNVVELFSANLLNSVDAVLVQYFCNSEVMCSNVL